MSRFVGWQRFEFGPQKPSVNRKGEAITLADYAIHAVCPWRIVGPEGIVVGSEDYGPDSERRDEQARPFLRTLAETPPVVHSLQADAVGSIRLEMTGGYRPDILPMGGCPDEQWLFLTPGEGTWVLDERGFGT